MDQHRAERVSETVREELAEIIGFELEDPRLAAVDVTDVRVAPNLFKTIYFLPQITSTVAIALIFSYVFQPNWGLATIVPVAPPGCSQAAGHHHVCRRLQLTEGPSAMNPRVVWQPSCRINRGAQRELEPRMTCQSS